MRHTRSSATTLFAWAAVALCLCFCAPARAAVQDITSQFAITRSALLLNRITNTFDQTVTLKNASSVPIPAPISAVLGGLPNTVTLANKAGQTSDGKPYVTPMAPGSILQPGATLSVLLKFSNPKFVTITYTLEVLYAVQGPPPSAPSLIGAVATGGTNAYLVGRVDSAANSQITLRAYAAPTCFLGSLVAGAAAGGGVATTTDAQGYFGVSVSGVNPGAFVAVQLTAPSASPMSACLVSSRDNDSWPKAFPLAGSPVAVQDFVDAPGKARWYKFSVTPGQSIQLKLSHLPGDYDVAVFKDIAKAFASQFSPATASASDLLKLTAEYAPTVFSPTVFSPTVFSPTAFSPTVFSPTVFSPTVFSPTVFSPTVFSPTVFSPTVFSPTVFSPTVFSPTVFSPTVFSPTVFSATEIAQAFSTAQTRSVIAVSTAPGSGDKALVANTWNNTGDFYVRVAGHGSAFNTSVPFTLNVTKGPTTCAAVTDIALNPRSAVPATGLNTVILTDSSAVGLDDTLPAPESATLRSKLAAFAQRGEVNGVVIDVAGDARVQALKRQAASNPACPFAVNLVAQEIKGIVDSYRANPLRYVVIAGNDGAIPFFRFPDESGLGPESEYVPPVQSNSDSEASLRLNFVLSQDAYGSKTSIALASSDFPVPGLAVGRLVETAPEIAGLIDAYVASDGVMVPHSSLVTGYDFLASAANAVNTELQLGMGAGGAADTLITPDGVSPQDSQSWTAAGLASKLFGGRHDVIFLAGHFSANSALAADFSTSLVTTDLVASTADFTGSVVFSAGCHSGYNLVDGDAIPGVTLPLDWAQAFARKRATLIAGTGYQYGDTDFIKYSAQIYLDLAREFRAGNGPVPVGAALVAAKLDYLATTPDIRGIPQKALLEATLFGLPMLTVNMPSGRGAGPGGGGAITPLLVAAGPARTLGLETYDLNVAPALTPQAKNLTNVEGGANVNASWLSGPDGVVSNPGEPVLPLAALNVTPNDPSLVLRGIGFRGGTYADSAPLIPFSGAPTTELRGVHVPFVSPVFYPALGRISTPNYFGALAGTGGTELLLTPAQHVAANPAAGTSTRRRYMSLGLRLFYSGNLTQAALSEAPSIVSADAEPNAGGVRFTAQVTGDPAAAIHQVWVTYTGDGANAWTSLDLTQCVAPLAAACGGVADSRQWAAQLAVAPVNLRYIVQAVSGVGLVALDDNRGAYYRLGGATPAATAPALVAPPTNATVGDSVNVTTKLTFAGVPVAGRTVMVTIGGITQLGTTAADGSVTVKLPVGVPPGTYTMTVAFAGDDTYEASSTTTSFTVAKAPSSLAALAPAGATLTGMLGGKTEALQQQAVSFSVTGPGGSKTIFVTTDELGRAMLPPPGLPAGNYTVTQALYGGNANFTPTSIALSQPFVVAKLNQSITFDPPADKILGDPDFAVFATASSGLAVAFGASGACTIAGSTVHLTGAGSCTITADQAGDANTNPAPQVARAFTIIAAPTVVSLARAQPSPTMAASVDYTLTFSEAVTGVAAGNFAVTPSGITGASVASISGSGTTWTVTVNTGHGTGTLRLDVANGTGIVDAANVALRGTPFSGETYDVDKGGTVLYGAGGSDGQPVASFGSGGYALFGDVPIAAAWGLIAVLSDGRILAASGVGCDPQTNLCTLQLGQYLPTGAPDASFGTSGRIVTSVTNVYPELGGISVNADGTFLVGGILNNGTNDVPFVARFTSSGAPDASFGTNGVTVLNSLPFFAAISGFAVDASGRGVIAGNTVPIPNQGVHTFVARLTSAGALDATFGSGGVATFSISPVNDQGRSVAIQPDGKIVVGGRTRPTPGVLSSDQFLVLRIDASGTLDPTFGTNGVATTRIAGTPGANIGRKLVLQPDGKIVLIGNMLNLDGTAFAGCGIARFNGDGTLDAGFGSGGQVFEPRIDQGCLGVSLQPDGKTVIVGDASDADVSIAGFLRLLLDGSPDPTFGNNGAIGISSYGAPAPVAVTSSGNLLTTLAVQDPADGVIKSYLVELGSTLAGPWLAQNITFGPPVDTTYGQPAFALNGSTSSGLPLSYTATGPCVVAASTVQVGAAGSCTITARQAGDATYFAATPVAQTFSIASASQVITFGPAPSGVTVGQPLVLVTASSSSATAAPSGVPIVFTSLTPAVCTTSDDLNGALLTLLAAGQCTIAADQPGVISYSAAAQATQTFTVGPAGAPPSVFTVTNLNDRGAGSLRAAIASANATAPGPNIVNFASGLEGTIVLTTGGIQISRAVVIQGPGADNITIDGNANGRIFAIFVTDPACPALDGPDYPVLISGLRLTNAHRNSDNSGGAIFSEHSLALDSVVIDRSMAVRGGGVSFLSQYPGQWLIITDSQFLDNVATELVPPVGSNTTAGGALNVQDKCTGPADTITDLPTVTPLSVLISNSQFIGNSAQPIALYGRGGAIRSYSLADIVISRSRIVGNHVDAPNPPVAGKTYTGGAMWVEAKSLLIERSEISDNAANDATAGDFTRSGGLHLTKDAVNKQGPADAMAVRIVDSTISGNTSAATAGAMLAFGNVTLDVDNSTVNNNSAAPARTGGIALSAGATYPVSASNTAAPTLKLVSSILANNSSTGGDVAVNTALIPAFGINAFNSLVQKPCATCSLTQIAISGAGTVIGADPLLAPLAFNGGPTRTHALLPGSPALNTGNNAVALNTDQRAHGFPRVSGVAADMGSYEVSQAFPLGSGTYVDRNLGLIGTSFLFDPTTVAGTLPSVTVTGPPSWNAGSPFSCVRYQPEGRQPIVDGAPFAYFTTSTGSLVVVDTATDSIEATVGVGANPYSAVVNPGGTRVYVSNFNDNTVSVIDASTNALIATVPVGAGPQGIAVNPSGTRVYVASVTANTVSVIDAGTNAVITSIAATGAVDAVVNHAGTRLYVADAPGVAIVDTATNTVVGSVSRGALSAFGTIAISADDARLYAWSNGSASVAVIDIGTSSVVATVPITSAFANDGIAVDPSGAPVYQSTGSNVSEIDPATNTVVHAVPLGTSGSDVNGVAVTPDGARVYAATSSGVRTFDTATETVTPIATGSVRALGHFIGSGPRTIFENAEDRSICWTFVLPVTGNYAAQGTAGSTVFTGSSSLDAASQLPAPQITSLTAVPGAVSVAWTAPAEAGSFLVRINPVPFTGVTDERLVSGASRSAAFSGLTLTTGANYEVTVFAFSQDLLTPVPFQDVFNVSAHSQGFVGP